MDKLSEQGNALLSLLPSLTTHRDAIKLDNDYFIGSSRDWLLGSIAIFYSRYTIHNKSESRIFRILMATVLAITSFYARRYDVVCTIQMFSYILPRMYSYWLFGKESRNNNNIVWNRIIMFLCTNIILGIFSFMICHNFECIATQTLQILQIITPAIFKKLLFVLFPITEFELFNLTVCKRGC